MNLRVGPAAACAAVWMIACSGEPPECESIADCASGQRCVDGLCASPVDPGECADGCECASDAECASRVPACVDARCVEGACFVRPEDARCASGERCDPSLGCVATHDGGADAAARADGSADAGAEGDAGSDGGSGGCGITSTHPGFQPAGFTQHIVEWPDAFYGNTFPDVDLGGLSPVGSFTFRSSSSPAGIPMAGHYISIPFVPAPDRNYRIGWYRAQAIGSRDYPGGRPAEAAYVTISPCPGDFRAPDLGAPRTDPRSQVCSEYAQDGNIFYGTTGGGSQCLLEPGRTYYLNLIFANPFDLDPTVSTCAEGPYCDANFSY